MAERLQLYGLFGEFAAATYCAIPLFFRSIHNKSMTQKLSCSLREYRYIVKYAFPINANQTVLHLLLLWMERKNSGIAQYVAAANSPNILPVTESAIDIVDTFFMRT